MRKLKRMKIMAIYEINMSDLTRFKKLYWWKENYGKWKRWVRQLLLYWLEFSSSLFLVRGIARNFARGYLKTFWWIFPKGLWEIRSFITFLKYSLFNVSLSNFGFKAFWANERVFRLCSIIKPNKVNKIYNSEKNSISRSK